MNSEPGDPVFVERAGEKLGPFPAAEVRRRLVAGTLRPDDRGWRAGSPEARPLVELFPPSLDGDARPALGKGWRVRIAVALALLLLAYLASPYVSLLRLQRALESGDHLGVEDRVDFAAVREGLKQDLRTHLAAAMRSAEGEDDPLAGLAAALIPAMADKVLDTVVTPSGLTALVRSAREGSAAREQEGGGRQSDDRPRLRYAFFTGPADFLVDYGGVKLRLRPAGLGWKVHRVELPAAMLDELQ
jgi:hypothetical protein